MKILMLTPYLPFPQSSGGQQRSYNLIKHLSGNHKITLFSLIKKDSERKYVGELEKYCSKVVVFKRTGSPWTIRNILRTGFGTYPFLVIRNLVLEEKEAIKKELAQNDYNLIHAETFYVMPHIPGTSVPILLVDQTIEYMVYRHFVDEQAPILLRPLLSIDVAKLKHWETAFWKKAKRVVAVSEADKSEMRKLVPNLKVDIVPNGVDLDFIKSKDNWKSDKPTVYFQANFKWLQNTEAAEILLDEIFPRINKMNPSAQLLIMGQNIPDEIKKRADGNITVADLSYDDEESIKKAYFSASVFVSPLRGPGGTRLKHFSAMAAKLPLVTTTVGAEGLGAKDGVHLIIRDNFQDIANETIKLLESPDLAREIGENARRLVVKNFDWRIIAKHLDLIYEETAKHQ